MPDTTPSRDELRARIESGVASDDEIAAYLGPDLMNELNAQFTNDASLANDIQGWYDAVMAPLGISYETTKRLYTGCLTIDDFVAGLDARQQAAFDADFERLQARWQHHLSKLGRS